MSDNLRMLGQYSAAMAKGDTDAVYEFFSEDFHSHVAERIVDGAAPSEDVRGSEDKWWSQARAALPDFKFVVDLLVEKDDIIVSNWTVTGTHTGEAFYDVPPSGEPVIINGTAILRVRDGKIVEHWGGPHCQDGLGLRPASRPPRPDLAR